MQAKIEGYQEQIALVKKALQRVGEDTDLGKGLHKALKQLESEVDSFSKKTTQRISSESQITKLTDTVNALDQGFIKLGTDMQKITVGDLKFSALSSDLQEVINKIHDTQGALDKMNASGFQEAVQQSKELKEACAVLGIDIQKLSKEQVGNKLFAGLDKANEDLKKATQNVNQLKAAQAKLQKEQADLQAKPINNGVAAKDLIAQNFDVDKIKNFNAIGGKIEEIKNHFKDAISQMTEGDAKTNAQKIVDSLIPTDTPQEIEKKIQEIVSTINTGKYSLKKVRDAFKDLNIGYSASGQSIAKRIFESLGLDSAESLESQFKTFMDKFGNLEMDTNSVEALQKKLFKVSPNDIDKMLDILIDAVIRARKTFNDEINSNQQELNKVENNLNNAMSNATAAQERQGKFEGAYQTYSNIIKELEGKMQEARNLLTQLEKAKGEAQAKSDQPTSSAGAQALKNSEDQLRANAAAASEYNQQLHSVKEAEKLVGKIEGIAQRWFSIYAAVRMVGQAINSVKSTLQELDKTITEIAIVTNMSQSDLWGQMGTYTNMAKQYAASISGVYQVSQLYYQQGLQTADVMKLTESTLKMARISGLDYAEATDYKLKSYVA